MPIAVTLEPAHLVAPAGSDVDGRVVVENPGPMPAHVRVLVSGEVAGWATVEPAEMWLQPEEIRECQLRFRLPRGAPGGVGQIPFLVRVLSDDEGAGGATARGSLDIVGQAELALRLLPGTVRGTLSATLRVAVDNLGETPARVQLEVEPPPTAHAVLGDDSVVVEAKSTAFTALTIKPRQRFLSGPPRPHSFWVRVEPLGGARISADGVMAQRSLIAGYGAVTVAVLAALVLGGFALSRIGGDDGDRVAVTPGPTTVATTTTLPATTAAPPPTDPGGVQPPPTTIPLDQRRIAFQSKRDGNYEIYTVNADGSDPQNVTRDAGHDGEPVWSPDHTRLAFDSNRTGSFDIYVMNADGSGLVQLTTEPAPDGYPAWSPDGTKIAFTSFRDGNSEIYVMNADGTGQTRLTRNVNDDSRPSWSPDGTKIAFHTDRDGNYEVYVMNADGSDPRNLSVHPAADKNPSWAPNGARLAFDSTRDGGKSEIYLMGADGTLPVRLTTNDAIDAWPSWSPDGRAVVFQSDRDLDLELYAMPAGGGAARRLTEMPGEDAEPAWAP